MFHDNSMHQKVKKAGPAKSMQKLETQTYQKPSSIEQGEDV